MFKAGFVDPFYETRAKLSVSSEQRVNDNPSNLLFLLGERRVSHCIGGFSFFASSCFRLCGSRLRFPQLVQLLEGPRPVLLQQTRQPAVGEHLPVRLAGCTLVAFVLRVADAQNGGVAHGAGLAIFAVDGHLFVEDGDFVGETVAHFLKKQRLPFG